MSNVPFLLSEGFLIILELPKSSNHPKSYHLEAALHAVMVERTLHLYQDEDCQQNAFETQ